MTRAAAGPRDSRGRGPWARSDRWGTGRRPGGPPPRKEGFGQAGGHLSEVRALTIEQMAITQRPLAVRRDLIRIFGEDRLVAVIRTTSTEIARKAAQAMSG